MAALATLAPGEPDASPEVLKENAFGPQLPLSYQPNKLLTSKVQDPAGNVAFVFSLVHDTPDENHGWKQMHDYCKSIESPPLLLVDDATCALLNDMSAFDFHVRLGKNADGETVVVAVLGLYFRSLPAAPLRQAMQAAEEQMSAEDARDKADEDAIAENMSAMALQEDEEEDAVELDPRLVQAMCAVMQKHEKDEKDEKDEKNDKQEGLVLGPE